MKILRILKNFNTAFEKTWTTPRIFLPLVSIIFLLLAIIKFEDSSFITRFPYFNYQADAFLHGQIHLSNVPNAVHDLIKYQDKLYLYWLPVPAILLMPFVYLFGINFSDVLFTVGISITNIYLCFKLLESFAKFSKIENKLSIAILVATFALGSVHLPLTPYGGVWGTSQLVNTMLLFLGYIFILQTKLKIKNVFLSGTFFSLSILTRSNSGTNIIFPVLLMYFSLLKNQPHHSSKINILIKSLIVFLTPIFFSMCLLLFYNSIRFSSPLDFGLDYHQMASRFVEDYNKYGAFNFHYIPRNFYYQYIYYPLIGPINKLFYGGSLFLMTPIFFSMFWSFKAVVAGWGKKIQLSLLLTTIATAIPILLLMGTGWVQYGPRYTLDFIPPTLLLSYLGLTHWDSMRKYLLLTISIVHYLAGTLILGIMRSW